MTHQLGIGGAALETARGAFSSADDVRRATGIIGLVLTFFFASSFTTAIQRVDLQAWRRAAGGKTGAYTRGPAWLAVMLVFMALLGGLRGRMGAHHRRHLPGPVSASGGAGAEVLAARRVRVLASWSR